MNLGINPPRMIVVMTTITSVVLLTIETWLNKCSLCSSASMVKINAKATDPRIVPAIEITESSLKDTVHFLERSLKIIDRTNIEVALEITHTSNSKRMKVIEKT